MSQYLGILISFCIFATVVYSIVKYDNVFKKDNK